MVLPEHLHAIWRLPQGDADFPSLVTIGRILAAFAEASASAPAARPNGNVASADVTGNTVRDETDLARHVDYIHYNPVKHGWVSCLVDWLHSAAWLH
jgi:putative transposase